MRILMTGSTGFIGRALAAELASQHELWEIVRDGPPVGGMVIHGDIRDASLVRRAFSRANPSVVVHLAAQALVGVGRRDPVTTYETNVIGTMNILETLRHNQRGPHPTFLVMATSDKSYGDGAGRRYKETDPMDGRGIYDSSKSCADLLARSYAETYNLDVRCARMGNVYGPGDREMSRVVPSIVQDIIRMRAPRIMSDGTPVRDYLYIDDAVDAYLDMIKGYQHGLYQPYNFSGGEPVTVLELAKLAVDVARADGIVSGEPEILGERTDEIAYQDLDCSRAEKLLGWRPHTSLRDGLSWTIKAAWKEYMS